jgi:hypothetical protein
MLSLVTWQAHLAIGNDFRPKTAVDRNRDGIFLIGVLWIHGLQRTKSAVAGLRGTHPGLEHLFDKACEARP